MKQKKTASSTLLVSKLLTVLCNQTSRSLIFHSERKTNGSELEPRSRASPATRKDYEFQDNLQTLTLSQFQL